MRTTNEQPIPAWIEFSAITRHYYVRVGARRGPEISTNQPITRKDDAERLAKRHGATSIEYVKRDPVRDLERFLGLTHETAKRVARENFR